VAVTAADLTAPNGELQSAWFGDLPAALAVWIPLGAAQAPAGATTAQADRVTTAYAYWRGFEDVLLRMSRDPNSVSIDKGDISASFSKDQRDRFALKADQWRAELDAAVAAVGEVVTVVIDNAPRASSSQQFVRSF
jgi:hypothetical protein